MQRTECDVRQGTTNSKRRATYQSSAQNLDPTKDIVNYVFWAAKKVKNLEIELHSQLCCLLSILQLLVFPRLGIDKSIGGLKFIRNDDFVLVYVPNEEQEGDGSSGVPVCCRKVLQPLKFSGYVGGELLNILCHEHAVAHELMKLKLCLLISADPEPRGRFIDVGEVRLHEHIHERHEVRVVKGCCSLCDKPKNLMEVQDCELEVLRRQLPTVGRPRSHPIGGGIVHFKVHASGRFLEVVLLSQEESKKLLRIGGELLNGLVLIGDELCSNKVLLSWSLQ